MPEGTTSRGAWVARAVAALNKHGSWTGRIHLHKHLYFTKELELAKPPFDFALYQYGPYSYELDVEIAQMELYGQLTKSFPSPGYGPRYRLSDLGVEEAKELTASDQEALERVAEAIKDSDSQALELQATCLWVLNNEKVFDEAPLIDRVKQLKPKYGKDRIEKELTSLGGLVKSLTGRALGSGSHR